jgi:hypothetical protein
MTANKISIVQAKLTKLIRANLDTFLYKHKGVVTKSVVKKTTQNLNEPID